MMTAHKPSSFLMQKQILVCRWGQVLWWSGEPSWCQDHSSTCWCPKNMFGDGTCAKFISSNDMHGFKWAVGHCCRCSWKCVRLTSLWNPAESQSDTIELHISQKICLNFICIWCLKTDRIHLWKNTLESVHYDSLSTNVIVKYVR